MSILLASRGALRRRVLGPPLAYSVDFENDLTGNTGADASAVISTNPVLSGSKSLKVAGGTNSYGVNYSLGGTLTEIYARQKIRVDVGPDPTSEMWMAMLSFGSATGNTWPFIFSHRVRTNGTSALVLWNVATGSEIASTADIPRGQTFVLGTRVKLGTTDGRIVVTADGATIMDYTGNTGTTGFDSIRCSCVDTNLYGATVTHYFDDLIGSVSGWPVYGSGGGVTPPEEPPATGPFVNMNVKALGLSIGRGMVEAQGTTGMDDMVAIGAQMLRTDMFFDNVQPTQGGSYVWGPTDTMVNNARARGLHLLLILNGPRAGSNWQYTSSADRAAFGDFAAAAAARYAGQCDHWAIMNEPNLDKMLPEPYTALIQNAYPKIKAANPNAFILGHNLAGAVGSTNASIYMTEVGEWMDRCYAAGISGYYDAVATHPYTWPTPPTTSNSWNGWGMTVNVLRPRMVANGESGLKVWCTEYGAPTQGSVEVSEAGQLSNLNEFIPLANARDWVGPIFWYERKDQGGSADPGTTENWFGLRRPDNTAKPALAQFTAFANAYPRLALRTP